MPTSETSQGAAGAPSEPDARAPAPTRGEPFPLAAAAMAVGIFGGVGASVGLFIALLASVDREALGGFLGGNELAPSARLRLSLGILVGATVVGGTALGALLLRGRALVPRLRRAGAAMTPLWLLGLLPSMFTAQPWSQAPLVFLVQLCGVVLAFEWTLNRSLRALPTDLFPRVRGWWAGHPKLGHQLPLILALSASTAYAVYFSYYTILNHQRLNTSGFDLGININWCYNALHGRLWRSTVLFGEKGGNFLSGHAIFAMLLYLPLFALHQKAEFFLIFQATMVGFAGTTLFLFASTQLPRWSALVVCLCFLMFAPVHGPNFYDYHELLPPLLLQFLLYWAIATGRNRALWLIIPVLWSFREDIPVGTCVLGLFLLLTGIRQRLGLILALVSLGWFVLLKFVIMPSLGTWWFADLYRDLQPAHTRGYGPVVQTMLINPSYLLKTLLKEEKLVYFLHMMAPLALLPMRRAALLVLAIPGFAFSLLTTAYAPTISIAFHYTCHAVPYLFAASVLMLKVLADVGGPSRRRAALGAVVLGVSCHSYVFGAVLQHQTFVGGFWKVEFRMSPEEQKRYQTVKRLAAMIPQTASVAATEELVPHVAARMDVFTLKDGVPVTVDYVFLRGATLSTDASRTALKSMFKTDAMGLLAEGDDIYLFKRGHQSAETAAAVAKLRIGKKRR